MKVRAEINKTEMKKTKERIHETKTLFFKKINKIEKTLAKLIEKKREIKETRNEGGEITTNITEIQTIISEQYKQRKTIEWERLHTSLRKLEIPRKHFMQK